MNHSILTVTRWSRQTRPYRLIGTAWLVIVAAEMLTGGVGIGFFIWDAWNSSLISDIILALVYVGLVGFVLDRIGSYVPLFAVAG